MENETSTTPKKGISPILIGLIIVILVVGGAAGYTFMQKQQTQSEMSENEQMEPDSTEPTAMPSGTLRGDEIMDTNTKSTEVKTVEVSGSNFKFAPNTISVKQGDTVKIVFKNTGGFHDFVIDELGVKTKQLADGASETVEFVASKKGTFEYYCSVGKHRQMGMVGTLVVE